MKQDFTSDALILEMFDGDIGGTSPQSLDFSDLQLAMEQADGVPYAGDGIVKRLQYSDLVKDALGFEVAPPAPAVIPSTPGAVPSKRPDTRAPAVTARRKKLESLIESSFARGGVEIEDFPKETIQSLLDALETYVSGSIKISRKVG
jgi:hypothetical protein